MAKSRTNKFIDTIDECLTDGVKEGIFQVSVEDKFLNGRTVLIDEKPVVNFGSCSYLGLEIDDRLKQGAIDATLRYGTQYSSSRAYSSCNLYEELEALFFKIFGHPAILGMSTTLTHVAAIPILIQDDDLVILDHQVHGSVQLAVQIVKARGTEVAMIKHNRMDMLEELLRLNPNRYNKIWYMADGLYSMYGDYAPLKDIQYLLEKYGNFHFYVDDAHGMSWKGKHGNGYILSEMPFHPKMVLTTSLAKGFGSGGGLVVLPDPEIRRKILTCGSSYTVSGPVQPPMLGASIASAKIHLTDEIYELQNKLKSKIKLVEDTIKKFDLPVVLSSDSPIFYLGLGLPRVGYNMVKRLLKEGYFTNIGIFPGVPVKCSGLRLPITNGQSNNDIIGVLNAFKHHFPKVLEEEKVTIDDISNSFNLPFEETKRKYSTFQPQSIGLNIQHEYTIKHINKDLWNSFLGDNGSFDWDGCQFLEDIFKDNSDVENNWNFHYLIITDDNKKVILATFFTELHCKDDMLSPSDVSRRIEELRKKNRYYLTSKVVMMGSLLSEGDHLFVDRSHPNWQKAFLEMIKIMNEVKKQCGATMIQLRDLDSKDFLLRDFLIKEGFIKVDMPDTNVIEDLSWSTTEDFLKKLSHKTRYYVRKDVIKQEQSFEIRVFNKNDTIEKDKIKDWFNLYKNVKNQSFNLNTFDLPFKLFESISNYDGWEVIEISFNQELKYKNDHKPLAMIFCYKSKKNNYCPMIIGINYAFNSEYNIYRQALYQIVKRAKENRNKKVYMGMEAKIEKQKIGAKNIQKSLYLQAEDNFNMELISLLKSSE